MQEHALEMTIWRCSVSSCVCLLSLDDLVRATVEDPPRHESPSPLNQRLTNDAFQRAWLASLDGLTGFPVPRTEVA